MFEPDAVDVPARCLPRLGLEGAGEVAGREAGAGGERLDGEVVTGVPGDPVLDLTQWFAAGDLRGELRTELGLVARPPQKDDEVSGDGERDLPAEVLLDESEERSMPAVTPADVASFPSRTKIGSGSTSTAG